LRGWVPDQEHVLVAGRRERRAERGRVGDRAVGVRVRGGEVVAGDAARAGRDAAVLVRLDLERLERAQRAAAIERGLVAVVARLARREDAVAAAGGRAVGVAAVAARQVAVVAGLGRVDLAVAAHLDDAGVGATVGVVGVAIVALLG